MSSTASSNHNTGTIHPISTIGEGVNQLLHSNQSFLLTLLGGGEKRPLPTYEDLCQIEARKLQVTQKSYVGSLFLLFSWRSTILRHLLFDIQFWITIGIYIVDRYYVRQFELPFTALVVIVGFMSFLLTFYLQNVISRYFLYYDACMDCFGFICDLAWLLRSFPKTFFSGDEVIKLIKYVNVAYVLALIELEPNTYCFSNLLEPFNQKYEYLSETDMSKLYLLRVDGSGAYSREVLSWTIDIVSEKVIAGFSDRQALKFYDIIFQLRTAIHKLIRMRDYPIPFVYTHFVYFLSALYTPLFAVLVADNFPLDASI